MLLDSIFEEVLANFQNRLQSFLQNSAMFFTTNEKTESWRWIRSQQ